MILPGISGSNIVYSSSLILLLGIILLLSACGGNIEPKGSSPGDRSGTDIADSLKTTFMKCGKADMIVLECGDQTMVIDTGEEDDGDKLVGFLRGEGIRKVDYLVITHFDEDHVGGAAFLLANVPVSKIIVPDYEGTCDEYHVFKDTLDDMGIREDLSGVDVSGGEIGLIKLTSDVEFNLGGADIVVDPPSSYAIPDDGREYDNDLSLITIVEHGDNRLLFMGDAENARMKDFLDKKLADACSLIKIPHHGKYHSMLKDVLKAVAPEAAVITDSGKNPAEKKTLELLGKNGVRIYSTAEGDVTAVSDGESLVVMEE